MKAYMLVIPQKDEVVNGGYYSVYDDGSDCRRELHIVDDSGNSVMLLNEQIGELLDLLKPALMG